MLARVTLGTPPFTPDGVPFLLEALGGLRLIAADGAVVHAQRRRLALLALLAAAGERGLTREQLLGALWPEASEEHAKHALNQLLYAIRRSLAEDALRGVDLLRLDPDVVDSDVRRFERALSEGAYANAVTHYRGPFLEGFYLPNAPEFERRVERERARLAAAHVGALERLATDAESRGDAAAAVVWRRALAQLDRLDARRATALMRALVAAGDPSGALAFARTYEAVIREELDAPASGDVVALANEIRSSAERPSTAGSTASIAGAATTATSGPLPEPAIPAGTASDDTPNGAAAPPRDGPLPRRRRRMLAYGVAALALAAAAFGARQLSSDLGVRLAGSRRPTARLHHPSVEAYEWYSKAMQPDLIRSSTGRNIAIDYLDRAIAADSNYAAAYAASVRFYIQSGVTPGERRDWLARAEWAAVRAVALDDSLPEAYVGLGWAREGRRDMVGAEAAFKQAIALDPFSSRAYEGLARTYSFGRPAEQLAAARRGWELERSSSAAIRELALALAANGRCGEALELLRPLKVLPTPAGQAGVIRGQCYAAMGMWQEAIDEFRWADSIGARMALAFLGYSLARAGQREEATQILSDLLARRKDSRGAFGIASVYAGLRNYDSTFVWLDRASDEFAVASYIMGPMFEDVRRDARFARFRERLGRWPPPPARADAPTLAGSQKR